MKTTKYLFLTLIILFVSVISCDDDEFLKEDPKSDYTLTNAFEKSSQVEAQLLMAYYAFYGFYGNAGFGGGLFGSLSYGTDALDVPYWQSGGGGNGRSNFGAYWNPTAGHVESVWNNLYQIISYANLTLMGADMEDLTWESEELRQSVIAQAHFFRGLAYLRLGELYGGVPINLEFIEELRLDYTRSTREQTYQQAIDDLTVAYNGLPDLPAVDGKIGKGAAATMLAEAHLAQGVETGNSSHWDQAIQYATFTINLHPLMTERFGIRANPEDESSNRSTPTYFPDGNVIFDMYVPGNYDYYQAGNTEAVWVMQTPTDDQRDQTGGLQSGDSWLYAPALRDVNWADEYIEDGAAAGPWKGMDPAYNPHGSGFPPYLGGFGISQIMPPNFLQYPGELWNDPDDYRHVNDVTWRWEYDVTDPNHSLFGQPVELSMLKDDNNFSKYAAYSVKVVPMDEWPFRSTENITRRYQHDYYAIRSAEAYLLRAEAYVRKGEGGTAADDLNALRMRANCSTMYDNADIQDVLDERLRELHFETGRWFTFLRMNSNEWKPRVENYSMYMADYPVYQDEIFFDLWPIPLTVINLNTEAEFPQNPGWVGR